jgi:hypothetical protein
MLLPSHPEFAISAGMAVFLLIAGWWAEFSARPCGLFDRLRLISLRVAGCWMLVWVVLPLTTFAQSNGNGGQITAQRVESLTERVQHIEALRIDARLSLLEEMKDRQVVMQQWVLGILGGVIVLVITQVLSLLQRPRQEAQHGHHQDD